MAQAFDNLLESVLLLLVERGVVSKQDAVEAMEDALACSKDCDRLGIERMAKSVARAGSSSSHQRVSFENAMGIEIETALTQSA